MKEFISIATLVLSVVLWGLFQVWLKRNHPDIPNVENGEGDTCGKGGCGGGHCGTCNIDLMRD